MILPPEIRRRVIAHVENLLRGVDLSASRTSELRDDYVDHLETDTRAGIRAGLAPDDALRAALQRFGSTRAIRRRLSASLRAPRGRTDDHAPVSRALAAWASGLLTDVRLSARAAVRNPAFATAVVLTLAIGIAGTTVVFSLVDSVLLQPLPFQSPDRLVAVWPSFWFSAANFTILERDLIGEGSKAFEGIAAYSPRSARVRGADGERSVLGPRVTAGFFDVLRPEMELGRGFDPDANQPGNGNVVVVTHEFWRRQLAAEPGAVGGTITVDSAPYTVVGVIAPDADLLQHAAELVVPKTFEPTTPAYRSSEMKAVARLKPGVSIEQARTEVAALIESWKEEYGLSADFGKELAVEPLRDVLVGEIRPVLLLLFGSVALMLLIAAANVVNLLLTRGIDRQREVAVRLALGARPGRVARLLLTDATVLSVAGAAAGVGLASLGLDGVRGLFPIDSPRLAGAAVDGRVVAFALVAGLLVAGLVTIAPAARLGSTPLRAGLASGGRGSSGRQRLRGAIVTAEIALALLLLIGSGLLVKSFWNLNNVDTGVQADGLVTFFVDAERGRLQSHAEAMAFHDLIIARLRGLAGVTGVARISQAPYNQDGGVVGCRAYDDTDPAADNELRCRWRTIGERYFSIAGTRLLRGRDFSADDEAGAEPVAIISEAAAGALFPGLDALGQRVATSFESVVEGGVPWATVVGIAADVRFLGLDREGPPLVYRPESQVGAITDRFGRAYGSEYLLRGAPGAARLPAVLETVRSVDPYGVVSNYRTMAGLIADSVRDRRAVLVLMATFSAASVMLGCIGIFGITAHAVRSRTRELGIRIAMGASGRVIVRHVLAGGLRSAVLGILIGLGLSLLLTRYLESFLYEVASLDASVAATAAMLALLVSCLATWIPARRAAQADPITALRTD